MAEPWFKAPAQGWPSILDRLPRPLSPEEVEHDLAWLTDQVTVGRVARMPGRVTLAARWGWSEKRTRLFLSDQQGPAEGPAEGLSRGQLGASRQTDQPELSAKKGQTWGQPRARVGASNRARLPSDSCADSSASNHDFQALPRARGTEHRAQSTEEENNTTRAPAHEPPATPTPEARAGVEEPQPVRLAYVRPGAAGNEEQREAALRAVTEPPVPRVGRNLATHGEPPRRPPVYRVGGKELPGAMSELLPRELAVVLAPHFRSDDLRSATQKLWTTPELRFMRGINPTVLIDLAIAFDMRWGIRPPCLQSIEVPYVAWGVDAMEDLCRLWQHQKGHRPSAGTLKTLVPDDERRAGLIRGWEALGQGNMERGWSAIGDEVHSRKAAK